MSNPTSNFGWQMPTATDLVTDLPADFEVFGQAVDTTLVDLKGGTTGQILAKNTNTDMDFVWITNDVGDITAVNTTAPLQGGGTSGALTLSIDSASTTVVGAVQLEDSTASTSTTKAATPNSVKSAYDLANGAIAKTTVTTAGDIIFRNATVPTRLGIGTAGQVLKVNSGATAPEWGSASSSFAGCWAYGLNQTIANGGTTYLADLGYENFDSDNYHSTTTNNSRITIPTGKGGKYQVNATVSFDNGNATVGWCQMFIRLNGTGTFDVISGTQIHATTNLGATGTNNNSIIVATGILSLAAADYIEMLVRSDNGSASSIRITPQLSVGYLGA